MVARWTARVAMASAIMSAAWSILRQDKALLWLPGMSSVSMMILVGSYFGPTIGEIMTGESVVEGIRQIEPLPQVTLFLSYLATYGIGIFFNTALAFCVLQKLEGKVTTIGDGLKEALSCLPHVLGWAIVSATVGLLLKAIEQRSGFFERMIVSMVGLAWGVATFLVVPILAAERKGPFEAVQKSVQLLRRTWGENLLAGMGFGALYFLWSLPGMFVFVVGAGLISSHLVLAIAIMVTSILYFPVLGLILSTMSTIFDVVLYRYARLGAIPPGFDRVLLETSFVKK
jgi:hypothetical protein